jgi:hypothetical protein
MSIEAMKQALEALEWCFRETGFVDPDNVMQNLRTAIAAAEKQEPVAWRYELSTAIFESGEYSGWRCTISEKEPCAPENSIRNLQPLYTHPPQRKPLTDEELKRVCAETFSYDPHVIARAIEAAHGITGEKPDAA